MNYMLNMRLAIPKKKKVSRILKMQLKNPNTIIIFNRTTFCQIISKLTTFILISPKQDAPLLMFGRWGIFVCLLIWLIHIAQFLPCTLFCSILSHGVSLSPTKGIPFFNSGLLSPIIISLLNVESNTAKKINFQQKRQERRSLSVFMEGGEPRSLEYTPTWIVAAVSFVIILISLCAERALHRLGKVHTDHDHSIHLSVTFECTYVCTFCCHMMSKGFPSSLLECFYLANLFI